ncbi:hypothetical protein ACMA110817_29380 [Achromobacter marplatensis]
MYAVFAPTRAPIAPAVTSIATLPTPSTPEVMPNQALRAALASLIASALLRSDTEVYSATSVNTPVAPALAPSRDLAHFTKPASGDIVGAGKARTGAGAGSANCGEPPAPGRGRALAAAAFSCASTSSGMM